ncbi:MAG: translation initiation factor IF-3, partial [Armatimonadetes bacterium]|nr:translation initiation factor IF-3 [Armatimonadota bacterium]
MRVISPEGEQLGIMSTQQAIEEARKRGLDLIEVAPNSDPPVCRIMDHGKFRYEQQKKAKETKKKSRQSQIKSIRIRPNTDVHDVNFKMRNAIKFLSKGDMVKFN